MNERGAGVPPAFFPDTHATGTVAPHLKPRSAPVTFLPEIAIVSRQRQVRYDHARLTALVANALPACLKVATELGGPLRGVKRIECTVVGTRRMAQVHRKFLNVRGPTDVLTFPYGEILVCASVAKSRAEEFGHDVTTELALYCIHALLHLAGHDDMEPGPARRMAMEQERILKAASAK